MTSHANPAFSPISAVRHGFPGRAGVPVGLALGVTAAFAVLFVAWSAWLPRHGPAARALATIQAPLRVFELNLPNVLTVFRILLVPVLVAALLSEAGSGDLLAAVVFAVASLTDALDGWIARRRRTESTFGKLMDPLADKLLITAALVSLVSLDRLSAGVAMVIIAREFAVTGLRQLAMEDGHVIPASGWGKIKTATQIAMVLVLIAVDRRTLAVDVLVYVTVVVTVASGADYFFNFRALLRARSGREPQT